METPISEILLDENQGQQHVQTDGSAGFAVGPDIQNQQTPLQVPLPYGPSQGQSSASPAGLLGLKEFFQVKNDDLLSVILVFGLLLLVSSSILNSFLSNIPMFIANDKLTPVGAVVVSIVFALIYFIIKVIGHKFF